MKTIASFPKVEQAYLLRARLESSGIPAYVRDEHLATIDWLYTSAIGGVKVDVSDDDFATAAELANATPDVAVERPQAAPRTLRPWHYAGVFIAVGLCAFVVMLVRGGAASGQTTFEIPTVVGLLAGATGAWIAYLRDRAE